MGFVEKILKLIASFIKAVRADGQLFEIMSAL